MVTFADTSALYTLLDIGSAANRQTVEAWDSLRGREHVIATSSYVYTESITLIQVRFGLSAVRRFIDSIRPLLSIEWIGQDTHEAAVAAMLSANRRDLSLVDCTSFYIMRRLGIRRAFALDDYFREQGFEVVP